MPADLRLALSNTFAGRYLVERELGRGGMATVYLVRDTRHDRLLALKVLHPDLAAFLGRERFLREIAVASRLMHPNILPLHDSGESDGHLFYLMPYVEGDTLRDRLEKEHPLPVEQAVRIARDVAEALAYAHDHNIVHRDIKPSNILLQSGSAIVADFGIARAISKSVDDDALTDSGLVLGTPAYMSPEQASAEEVDGRSDIYSLGCVLYEMLAGSAPFSGVSGRALLARHSLDPVPPIRTVRPSLPPSIEAAVLRSLEKIPADRYATAREFAADLHYTGPSSLAGAEPTPPPRRLPRGILFAIALVAGVAWLGWQGLGGRTVEAAPGEIDTSRYLILSPATDGDGGTGTAIAQLLRDEFSRWKGVSVVDPFLLRDALGSRSGAALDGDAIRQLAAQNNAGRFIRMAVTVVGESLRVNTALFDTRSAAGARPIGDQSVHVARDLSHANAALGQMLEALLVRTLGAGSSFEAAGTTSIPALRAFAAGEAALHAWNLAEADSHFTNAAEHDPGYARASLWAALARMWSNQPAARWRSLAEGAAANSERLSERDSGASSAVLALARGDISAACAAWAELARRQPRDFIAWYGRADCLRRDDVVVADRGSPTGWRFRSSYHEALGAYQQAFQLLPSIHRALRGGAFGSLRTILRTSQNQLRAGRGLPPDTTMYVASPSWVGDSLVLYPVPERDAERGRPTVTATTGTAIRQQRQLFHDIASGWVAAYPQSPEALEALAIALEMLGESSALDTLRRARRLASTPADRLQLAGREGWLLVKQSRPAQVAALRQARVLADSLLESASADEAPHPRLLASIAALTGRASLAARLSRRAAVRGSWNVPPPLGSAAPALLVFAALGGPADSLHALEALVASTIDRALPSSERRRARAEWLARPATLAFPDVRLAAISSQDGGSDYLLNAQAAFARGNIVPPRNMLERVRPARRAAPPYELPIDALYPEAWLLAAIGDSAGAAAWLDPTLGSLAFTDPQMFADAARGGPLVRSMAFRAELAHSAGDDTAARQWAAAVTILWSNADGFLQPVVRRMEALTRN